MSVVINASTTAGLVMTSDLSGTLSLQSNGVAVTMPAVAGTMMVSGNMPAFSAYANTSQTVSVNTFTKVTLANKDFDTNNNFASSRFTPTVAGYYQFNATLHIEGGTTTTQFILVIAKNASIVPRLIDTSPSATLASNTLASFSASSLIYMNGSTDYVELYGYYNGGTCTFSGTSTYQYSYLSGSLVRAA